MAEKKNICITINSLASGGAEKQALLLAKALKSHHTVILVILNPQPIYQAHVSEITQESIDHLFLPKNPFTKAFRFIRFLKKKKIDIIFSFLPTDTILSAICGKIAGVPNLFGGIRNSFIPKFKFYALRTVHNYLLNYTIANNYTAHKTSIEFGFNKKVFVIPNGIEIRPSAERKDLSRKTINIISLGRLVKQKDYKTALKCIAELKKDLKSDYKINYRIVGSGPEKENIIANIEKYGLENEVELIASPSNIYDLLKSSDMYLCTSLFEGISNAIMEAMNSRLPIIATNAGDNSRLVIHGKNGFISDLGDHKKLSEHIHYLIASEEVRNQMGLESYNHLVQSFSYAVFQRNYLNIIENIEAIQIHNGEYVSN